MEEIKEGYTRVSEIVGWFKANELAKIDPDTLRKKAHLGTNVHAAIAGYDEGIYVPLDEKEMGYFESFKVWKSENDGLLMGTEQRFYCDDLMITGAVDCITCDTKTARGTILDFKTTIKEDPIGWPLQAAFYHYLASKNGFLLNDEASFIQLQKDGTRPVTYTYGMSKKLKKNMMMCYETYKLWHLTKKEVISKLY